MYRKNLVGSSFKPLEDLVYSEHSEYDISEEVFKDMKGTGESKIRNVQHYIGKYSDVAQISVQSIGYEILSLNEMNSSNHDIEMESPINLTRTLKSLRLFDTGKTRQTLNIKAQKTVEDSYDRIKQGRGTQTKSIKNYCARLQKHLQFRANHKHISCDEAQDVAKFKSNNNLPGLKSLFGFVVSEEGTSVDTGRNDDVRKESLAYCLSSADGIILSGSDFAGKLTEIKYLHKLEQAVVEPEKVSAWKD